MQLKKCIDKTSSTKDNSVYAWLEGPLTFLMPIKNN
jgi:hypothetical protein